MEIFAANTLSALVERLGKRLIEQKMMVVVAESCTGGGIAQAMTSLPDSGQWFDRGYVTYSIDAKKEMLGVAHDTIEQYGAISTQTAIEMAAGALAKSHAQIGVAVTGVAGPDKGPQPQPVGTVCFAWIKDQAPQTVATTIFAGNRDEVCQQAILMAILGILDMVDKPKTGIKGYH